MIISIITATYNASEHLEDLIKSIIPQKSKDIEFIIIDGQSKDSTVDIIEKYSNYVDFWVSESDNGIYDAWNKGLKKANGKWIMFLGADDKLLDNSLNKYIEVINKNKATGNIDFISAQNRYISRKSNSFLKLIGGKTDWDIMKKRMPSAHVGALHNKKLFDEVGLYDTSFKICADYELLLRKGNNLSHLFISTEIAEMRAEGMSFSTAAIKETYRIRRLHHTISTTYNNILYFRDLIAFYRFKIIYL